MRQQYFEDLEAYRGSGIVPIKRQRGEIFNFPKKGDRIHIYSRSGIYTIMEAGYLFLKITCNTWYGDYKYIPLSDFKCHVGMPGSKKRREESEWVTVRVKRSCIEFL